MPRALGPALAAGVLHASLLAGYVAAFGGDLGALVCVGADRAGQPPFEVVRTSIRQTGYDGAFYYAIARAPFHRHVQGVDLPPVRHLRILYPAAGWLLSSGDPYRLLWALPLVNVLAIAGLAGLGAGLALRRELSPWWGLLLPLAVNAGVPALRDLTDVLSTLALCGLLVTWVEGGVTGPRWWVLTLWAAASLFCREQNVPVVLVVLGACAWQQRGPACAGLAAVLLLWSGWVVALRLAYGSWPFLPAQGCFGIPFGGMLFRWAHLTSLSESRLAAGFHALGLMLIAFEIALALYLLRRRPDPVLALATLGGVALAVCGGVGLYGDSWSYPRVFALLPLGLWLSCVHLRRPAALLPLGLWLAFPLATVAKAWLGAV